MQELDYSLPTGTQIAEFRIIEILGVGGFGITYKAEDTRLDRLVAIKEFLPVELAARATDSITVMPRTNVSEDYQYGLSKFLEEAKTLAKFNHPNIVKVLTFIEENGTAYLVMEYVEGQALDEHLKKIHFNGNMAESRIREIIESLLQGLAQVHKVGLLHRDIKPGNIYLQSSSDTHDTGHGNHPMLIDFGAARQSVGEKSKSISAIISQGYAPPEQYTTRGKQGPYTDIYAIAAVMYYLVSGEKPVESTDRQHQIMDDEADPLVALEPSDKYSESLISAISQGLLLKPKMRPQNVDAMLAILKNPIESPVNDETKEPAVDTNATRKIIREKPQHKQASEPKSNVEGVTPSKQKTKTSKISIFIAIAATIGGFIFIDNDSSVDSSIDTTVNKTRITQPETTILKEQKTEFSLNTEREKQAYSLGSSIGGYLVKKFDEYKEAGVLLPKNQFNKGLKESFYERGSLTPTETEALLKELEEGFNNKDDLASLQKNLGQYAYALGTSIANYLIKSLNTNKELGVELENDIIIKGVNDSLDSNSLIEQENIKSHLMNLEEELKILSKEKTDKLAEKALQDGKVYLAKNAKKSGVTVTPSGLQYQVLKEGTGIKPHEKDTVEVHYKGMLIDGTTFDSSYERGERAKFPLNRVIKGWTEGLQLMPAGSKYKFTIPSDLAYGNKGNSSAIPGNSVLEFVVELFEVEKYVAEISDENSEVAAKTTSSGLKYQILTLGKGKKPQATDTVVVHYKGSFLNGKVFDSSYERGEPATIPLNGVITGWTEGLQLMPVGSTFKFTIPPELAYGKKGAGTIPANATLNFEVELLAIEPSK